MINGVFQWIPNDFYYENIKGRDLKNLNHTSHCYLNDNSSAVCLLSRQGELHRVEHGKLSLHFFSVTHFYQATLDLGHIHVTSGILPESKGNCSLKKPESMLALDSK